jgi:hypothetical protein
MQSLKLFRKHARTFLKEDWPEARQPAIATTFERGFVVELNLNGLKLDLALFRDLARRPLLTLIQRWWLSNCELNDEALRAIADCVLLGRLKRLELAGNRFTNAGLEFLAASPFLRSLESISVDPINIFQPIETEGATEFAVAQLEELWAQQENRVREIQELFKRYGKSIHVSA